MPDRHQIDLSPFNRPTSHFIVWDKLSTNLIFYSKFFAKRVLKTLTSLSELFCHKTYAKASVCKSLLGRQHFNTNYTMKKMKVYLSQSPLMVDPTGTPSLQHFSQQNVTACAARLPLLVDPTSIDMQKLLRKQTRVKVKPPVRSPILVSGTSFELISFFCVNFPTKKVFKTRYSFSNTVL